MRIAIITTGTPNDKKGAFNATHQRIRHLILKGIEVDVFIIRYYDSKLMQILRRRKYQKEAMEEFFIYDNVKYTNLWIPLTITDYFQMYRLNQLGSVFLKFARKWTRLFAGYDLISAHSLEPGIIATFVKAQFGVPFAVTWHGSDIHSMPKMNRAIKVMTIKICRMASAIFFVSRQLQSEGINLIGDIANTDVLYNAVDGNKFYPYPAEKKEALKQVNRIDGIYNIGFIGSLVAVKNSQLLPDIFKQIAGNIENAKFYLVGDGKFKSEIAERCREFGLDVIFMGNRSLDEMPGLINCFDLVVLPSINEGMPLIVLECLSCQVPIIASKVGGIPEVLGQEYTVAHGPGFVERFANIAINILRNPDKKKMELSPVFNWEQTAAREAAKYLEIVNKS
jgi:teichuronic acid biosynthesis glycosyltransferase TuaC